MAFTFYWRTSNFSINSANGFSLLISFVLTFGQNRMRMRWRNAAKKKLIKYAMRDPNSLNARARAYAHSLVETPEMAIVIAWKRREFIAWRWENNKNKRQSNSQKKKKKTKRIFLLRKCCSWFVSRIAQNAFASVKSCMMTKAATQSKNDADEANLTAMPTKQRRSQRKRETKLI